ncbi:MAG: hypothetical protein Q8O88_05860 [bacterium]|nr:hypothetical protein [bacterium]
MEEETLEWQILNYRKICKVCFKKLTVHAYKKKRKGKPEIVYAHCCNEECELYGFEVPPHAHGG